MTQVTAIVGASLSSASRWRCAWRAGGEEALRPKHHPGPKPKLKPRQHVRLLAALKRGTQAWDYAPDLDPLENVWNQSKNVALANWIPQNIVELQNAVDTLLSDYRHDSARLSSFFQSAHLRA